MSVIGKMSVAVVSRFPLACFAAKAGPQVEAVAVLLYNQGHE